MCRIDVITLFPEMFSALESSITGRAIKQNLYQLHLWNPRHYTDDKHGRVDDHPYGGGPGLVMQVQPLRKTIEEVKKVSGEKPLTIYLSPKGKSLKQTDVERLSKLTHLILVCGRYEGIDQRVIDHDIDEEFSVGDYILSGGELPAMILIDALVRLLPNALGDPDSASLESFCNDLLEYPQYTRPPEIDHQKVPEILLSGDHQAISDWRLQQSLGITWLKRPDLLKNRGLTPKENLLLQQFINALKE